MGNSKENRQRLLSALTRPNRYSLTLLFIVWGLCGLFYYLGEIVYFFNWVAVRWDFLYSVHDFHRALFLFPLVYAGYIFGVRVALTLSILTMMLFLPRAIFISPYPDPILRMLLFMLIAGGMSLVTAVARREYLHRTRLQEHLLQERDRMLHMLEGMDDGVAIIGPDYRIRYMNQNLRKKLPALENNLCYQQLRGLSAPCGENCYLAEVLKGSSARWEYKLPDGSVFEAQASPFRDVDGVTCQLTILRDITPAQHPGRKPL